MIRALAILFALTMSGVCRAGFLTDFSASYALYQQCAMNGADFDADEDIDGTDYLQWQRGMGMVGQFINPFGDADRNGAVNQLDLMQWQGQYGANLAGLPESECFKLFLEPEGIISGSVTMLIDAPNPNPGQNRFSFGQETRIIDVHPQYSAQVLQQNVFALPGRQLLVARIGFTANNPATPPGGPLTIFGYQAVDLMPQLGLGGVVTQIQFTSSDSITVFDSSTGVTTTFDDTQLDDVTPKLTAPLTLDVNTVTGDVSLRNPITGPISLPIVTGYYEISSLTGSLNPTGWVSIDETEADPPGVGWEEAAGANPFKLSESALTGALELNNGQTRSLGHAYNEARGARDLRFFYATPQGAMISGEVNYITPGPVEPVPEPAGLPLAFLATAWVMVRRRRPCA